MILKINQKNEEELKQSLVQCTEEIACGYINRALCYEKLNETENAQKDFKTAQEMCTEEKYYYHLAWHYQHNDEAELAIEYYSKVISINPQDGSYFFNRAKILKSVGKYEEAICDLEKVLGLETLDWVKKDTYIEKINCYIGLCDYEKALALCDEYAETYRRWLETPLTINKLRIEIYEKSEDYKNAIKAADSLLTEYNSLIDNRILYEIEEGNYEDVFTVDDVQELENKKVELEEKLNSCK